MHDSHGYVAQVAVVILDHVRMLGVELGDVASLALAFSHRALSRVDADRDHCARDIDHNHNNVGLCGSRVVKC